MNVIEKLSVAITTYERIQYVKEAVLSCIAHPSVDEVIIVDDCSPNKLLEALAIQLHDLPADQQAKLKMYRNEQNLGMLRNKERSVRMCKNDWVVMLDSDNELHEGYIDAVLVSMLKSMLKSSSIIFCPSKAEPNFDFSMFESVMFNEQYILDEAEGRDGGPLQVLLNTCNYVVNRKFYLEAFEPNDNIKGSDTIFHAYNHLKKGGVFYVVPNMTYTHRVHPLSTWMQHSQKNMADAKAILSLIKDLAK